MEHASQRQLSARRRGSVTVRQPDLDLESVGVREHTHWPIDIPIQSFGCAAGGAPAHAREHRTSIAVRG